MTIKTSRCFGTLLLACCALAFSAAPGWAQGVPLVVPSIVQPQMSPQQLQSLMMMRMMQSRGRHSVRTGFPQDIQMAPGVGGPTTTAATPPATDVKSKSHKSSAERRAEARRANEEKKRAAKEEAKAKKAKLAKHVKADDNAADAQ